ncbi:uncharacterized protein LOC132601867 [Lycium barbarum]|uniref:uncharacterized protein LOC132601867 n=1 Tax=Lycium barbarum TaxID=112863 RepID=UPI00293E3626|nr:uncharacterized protein LOC132601867 [Lycium barbarum]
MDCVRDLGYDPRRCSLYARLPKNLPLIPITSDRDTMGIAACLGDGDILETFVCHMVEEPQLAPLLLEYATHVGGADVGFDESEGGTRDGLEGKLAGDEPYYPSDEAASFETDPDDCTDNDGEVVEQRQKARRRKVKPGVVFDKTCKKVTWETGLQFESVDDFRVTITKYAAAEHVDIKKHVNEPLRVRVRCVENCPWLLFASFDSRTYNFVVKNYNPIHKCDPTNRNKLCNSKFLASHYNERIKEQPRIRIFELQQLIKKELDLYIGRTVCRRAKNKVISEMMGDHVKEFDRILDYKDELLRSNPGSTCVVRLSEETIEGRKRFVGFYICFDAMKKSYLAGCRKCIGVDGCFLKGISKGQLLVVVCKDGNNQMLPLAWAVVEVENKHNWTWFIKILKEDLQLGDGTDMAVITDMQKGLEGAIKEQLPNVEHRMCARHVLANWSKDYRGLERRNCFWRCARSTFEAELNDNLNYMKTL